MQKLLVRLEKNDTRKLLSRSHCWKGGTKNHLHKIISCFLFFFLQVSGFSFAVYLHSISLTLPSQNATLPALLLVDYFTNPHLLSSLIILTFLTQAIPLSISLYKSFNLVIRLSSSSSLSYYWLFLSRVITVKKRNDGGFLCFKLPGLYS